MLPSLDVRSVRSSATTPAFTATARPTSSAKVSDVTSRAPPRSESTSCRIPASEMKPHLTTSASPDATSVPGSSRSRSRSQITTRGSWKAPTRFFPVARLMPVFPPTAASTMPSTVVGMLMKSTPRSQLAATNPARSVAVPPPSPTTRSLRVNPAAASSSQHLSSTAGVLAASASGTVIVVTRRPGQCFPTCSARALRGSGTITATRAAAPSDSPSRSNAPGAMCTW